MLQSKCGTIHAATGAAGGFFPMLDVGNTINGTTGQKITVKSIFVEYTGETGSSKATKTPAITAYNGTTAITLDTTSVVADAGATGFGTIDNFTTEIAMGKGSAYVNKIGITLAAKTGAVGVGVKYIINYE